MFPSLGAIRAGLAQLRPVLDLGSAVMKNTRCVTRIFKRRAFRFSRNESNYIRVTTSFNRVIAIDGVSVSGVIFTPEGVG
jgi:hypothetical protein